jgi:hypothetical protein
MLMIGAVGVPVTRIRPAVPVTDWTNPVIISWAHAEKNFSHPLSMYPSGSVTLF